MSSFDFIDPISGRACSLIVPPDGRVFPLPGQRKIGVGHPDCGVIADLSIGYDAFYCTTCQWNGRVSGAWCIDMIELAFATALDRAKPGTQMACAYVDGRWRNITTDQPMTSIDMAKKFDDAVVTHLPQAVKP